jgi:sugar phosphate isomerase/epimerase
MTAPLGLQLYSVRDALGQDFDRTIDEIADIGYVGVEVIYDMPGATREHAARRLREAGLEVLGAHTPPLIGDDRAAVLEFAALFGVPRLIGGFGAEEYTPDRLDRTIDLLNEASLAAEGAGISYGVHNHWWEFEPVDGVTPHTIMREQLRPEVFFELDTYWITVAGANPARVIEDLGNRAPLLHIKDGPIDIPSPHVAVGAGQMDIEAIVAASRPHASWLITEIDWCATDMLTAVRDSHTYMTGRGYARGAR